jgi:2-oxoisovalerate dehydrogenase E1 component
VFLEPIALYQTADLDVPGDGAWLEHYRPGECAELGRARLWDALRLAGADVDDPPVDLLFVTFANGVPMCLRVARRLAAADACLRVLDLRWLAPLPLEDLRRAAGRSGAVLVVDETRATGSVSEALVTALQEMGYRGRVARVASRDSFIPLGPAAELVLLSEAEIEAAARQLLEAAVVPR